jgi:hypothetical protein
MKPSQPNKQPFPFPPGLVAADAVALVVLGLCFAEAFPKHGKPLGFIPPELVWPLLIASAVVAAVCAFFQIRILLKLKKTQVGAEQSAMRE